MTVFQRVLPISLVIPTYQRPQSLLQTVQSYLAGDAVPAEIIVVDQSPQEVRLAVSSSAATRILVVHEDVACTPRARNIGVKLAEHDVILLSDGDILVRPNSLDVLWRSMSRPEVALLTTVPSAYNVLFSEIRPPSLVKVLGALLLGRCKPFQRGFYIIKSSMLGNHAYGIDTVQPVTWAPGCFFCVRKALMERWDCWFDERLACYATAEDLDFTARYCRLARDWGFEALVDPAIYANHLATKEWRTSSARAARYFVVNHRYISTKLYPTRHHYRVLMNAWDALYARFFCKDREYAAGVLDAIANYRRNPHYFDEIQGLAVDGTPRSSNA